MARCSFKVSIIGGGKVGITAAYAMLLDGTPTDLVIVSRDLEKLKGEQLDLDHSLALLGDTNIVTTDQYDAVAGSQLIIITAGAAQKVGESRLDLRQKNVEIISQIIPKITAVNRQAVIVIVSNPVDVLSYHAIKAAGLAEGQVFGTGTMLDTARFRFHLSQFLGVSPRSIHSYILGEHGDSSFPVLSSANIGGQLLSSMPEYDEQKARQAFEHSKNAAYQIIQSKGSTYYAIATVILRVMHAIFKDAKTVLPVSTMVNGYYDIQDVALSLPCIIGARGVEKQLQIQLSPDEVLQLQHSAEVIRKNL